MNKHSDDVLFIIQCEDWNSNPLCNLPVLNNTTSVSEIPENSSFYLVETGKKIFADTILAIQERARKETCCFFAHGSDFLKKSISHTEIKNNDIIIIENWKNEDIAGTLQVEVYLFQHEIKKCPVYDDLLLALESYVEKDEKESYKILETITYKFNELKRDESRGGLLSELGFDIKINFDGGDENKLNHERMLI